MNKAQLNHVETGAKAILRTHKHWDDWVAIIPGLVALRKEALRAGALKSSAYNAKFGELLEEYGYGEDVLEKNSRAALLNIGQTEKWARKLDEKTEGWGAAGLAAMTPRAAWELIRPQTDREPSEERRARNSRTTELEADLGDAEDRLNRSLQLDREDLDEQIAKLMENPELAQKLLMVYEALHQHFAALTARKADLRLAQ